MLLLRYLESKGDDSNDWSFFFLIETKETCERMAAAPDAAAGRYYRPAFQLHAHGRNIDCLRAV
ncbi:hypothetical protein GCM10010911_49290 [Paenibacillus nasutitermitis]|uniref:Uncharacterized protein n=1 Tax=Paenibacillus nasutitermitis TaxID=1652958 RepID=A0A916ZC23_9BACL|nr:hypothetical protein GCM10010911_49290 [Paenibacillus nasutitermitis]